MGLQRSEVQILSPRPYRGGHAAPAGEDPLVCTRRRGALRLLQGRAELLDGHPRETNELPESPRSQIPVVGYGERDDAPRLREDHVAPGLPPEDPPASLQRASRLLSRDNGQLRQRRRRSPWSVRSEE